MFKTFSRIRFSRNNESYNTHKVIICNFQIYIIIKVISLIYIYIYINIKIIIIIKIEQKKKIYINYLQEKWFLFF